MGLIDPTIPTLGDANSTEDPDIRSALITIRDVINGNIDSANAPTLSAAQVNHAARVYRTTSANIPNSSEIALTYDAERFDTSSIHSTSANLSRLTIPANGVYCVSTTVYFSQQSTSAGQIQTQLRVNGATNIAAETEALGTIPVTGCLMNVSTIYKFSLGDYVETFCYQDSGVPRLSQVSANQAPEFGIAYLCAG